ncbi:hypothetical protein LEP1GSC188_0930 [Leptospira weilii serovar Topaz str. LT2116]|uniref:Uncharacterized protein n=1 Tax=Leptospira weilii serovar Topaz str. LT2116 TaxID=1088540 RepID=M3GY52_9LEPT|nr:hypothetical protein LEP1GSC188_0930 [Leptospira weilii serovar Topaz str. LT2116]
MLKSDGFGTDSDMARKESDSKTLFLFLESTIILRRKLKIVSKMDSNVIQQFLESDGRF